MAFCEGCGRKLEADALFCERCGRPVPQERGWAEEETAFAASIEKAAKAAKKVARVVREINSVAPKELGESVVATWTSKGF